ncbi:hypothetical protein BC941DRAFT_440878 [Chlamydoabsidia padenii]|nr:hypothetical protein BC941DRAFT_440878 [Chlamydoabsidia padenii]
MTPTHNLPYDLLSLNWNKDHTRNDQALYCYCGKDYKEHKTMVRCGSCQQLFHPECIPSIKKPLLYGDIYYDYECSACTHQEEKYQRQTMKWKEVVELVLYHITMQRRYSKGKQLDKFFFRFSTEICDCLEHNWDTLLFDRHRSSTWKNTVASSLSTHPELFLSGVVKMEEYGKGWWALQSEVPPQKQIDRLERQSISKPDVIKKLKKQQSCVATEDDADSSIKRRASLQNTSPVRKVRRSSITLEKVNKQDKKSRVINEEPKESLNEIMMEDNCKSIKAKSVDRTKKSKSSTSNHPTLIFMSQQEEWQIYQTLDHVEDTLSPLAARFKRKLALRRLKRNMNLKLSDIDQSVTQHLRSTKSNMEPMIKTTPTTPTSSSAAAIEQYQASSTEIKAIRNLTSTPYHHSFASRLHGRSTISLTNDECWLSAWNGRKLRPYIRRDYENKPVRLRLLKEIKAAQGRPRKQVAPSSSSSSSVLDMATSIDYVYFQREHLEQANQLLARCFWDGVDVSESLQFPEFSVIALYKRCVIGCAFMTPEAYITYFAVMAGWERAGIGQFMLYHLFQTAISKDITLHVSANNNAMILYQKFGFKPEEFIVNFYDKYLPAESSFSKNAFFLRLRR